MSAIATDLPAPEARDRPFVNFVADVADGTVVPLDDDDFRDLEPIKFTWDDPAELFEFIDAAEDAPDEDPLAAYARELEIPTLPVYESPLVAISSPLPAPVEVPVRVEAPATETSAAPPATPLALPTAPAPAAPTAPPVAAPRRRSALAGSGAVIAVAAAAAMMTNALTGDDDAGTRKAASAGPALAAAERDCMKEWNTTLGGSMGELRVTLGQFQGALAQVARVKPLPGTVMAADSCALTVYDPASDTRAVFVSGVQDQTGYIDVTSYPRASQYGAPRTKRQANVSIRPDGSLRSL